MGLGGPLGGGLSLREGWWIEGAGTGEGGGKESGLGGWGGMLRWGGGEEGEMFAVVAAREVGVSLPLWDSSRVLEG